MPKKEPTRSPDLDAAMQRKTGAPEEGEQPEQELETPTSNDVGKQTLTKADMGGRDVTKEGVPEEAFATPRHPDDPSADDEDEPQEVET